MESKNLKKLKENAGRLTEILQYLDENKKRQQNCLFQG
jgi:hypothetical protein